MTKSAVEFAPIGRLLQDGRRTRQLTQEQLAQRAGVPYTTLTKVESGAIRNPSAQVVSRLARALGMSLDSLFTPQVYHGPGSVNHIFRDGLESLKSGDTMCISGVEEGKYIAEAKEVIDFVRTLKEMGVSQRLLTCEGDATFLPGDHLQYRWISPEYFSPVPIYVYADRVAILMWGPPQQAMIIQNAGLAEAYRRQFTFLWDHAKPVPRQKPTKPKAETPKARRK